MSDNNQPGSVLSSFYIIDKNPVDQILVASASNSRWLKCSISLSCIILSGRESQAANELDQNQRQATVQMRSTRKVITREAKKGPLTANQFCILAQEIRNYEGWTLQHFSMWK